MTRRHIGLISDTHGLVRPEALRALQGVEAIIQEMRLDNTSTRQTAAPDPGHRRAVPCP